MEDESIHKEFWVLAHLWGKSFENSSHPSVLHMIDVGLVVEAVLQGLPKNSQRILLSIFLTLNIEIGSRWLAFIAALHDIGKVSPGFVSKVPARTTKLIELGFSFKMPFCEDHGRVGFRTLQQLLVKKFGIDPYVAVGFSDAVVAHHGSFYQGGVTDSCGTGLWESAREKAVEYLLEAFALTGVPFPEITNITASWAMLYAGLVSVSDWIGSNEVWFPFHEGLPERLDEYVDSRRKIAMTAARELGFAVEN